MPKTKVEVYNKDQLIYPFIESDHVTFSNGMKVSEMLDQSISMPKVIHEDLSFKVGVGDQDVSSAIVDSSVAEMTIKGKTYQNILPEPSTLVLTNNKEMFKVNEGLDSNIEIVDGVGKSAILSGNTLVNLMTKCKDEYVVRYHDINNPNNNVANFSMMKPNTEYTLLYKAKYRTEGDGAGTSGFLKIATSIEKGFIGTAQNLTTEYKQYVYKITTSSVVDCFVFASTGSYFAIKECVLLEGDYTQEDVSFFEGMKSVKMPILTTTGKNLLPPVGNTWYPCRFKQGTTFKLSTKDSVPSNGGNVVFKDINGTSVWFGIDSGNTTSTKVLPCDVYYISNSLATGVEHQLEIGKQVTSYEPYKTNILSCELVPMNQSMFEQGTFAESTPPNTKTYQQIKLDSNNLYDTRIRTKGTYKVVQGATYEVQLNDGYGIFICYCKNGLYSATINRWLDGTSTFTVPNDCDEMFFAIRKTDNSAITSSDYSRIGLKIHQEVVLRSLPNGVCDTLNLNTGEYVQRIGEVVLDGSEAWNKDTTTGGTKDNTSIFHTEANFNGFKPSPNVEYRDTMMLCDKIPVKGRVYNLDEEGLMINGDGRIYIRINLSRLETNNAGGFKSFLAKENIKIQCELATPVVKTVDLSSSGNWEKVVLDGKSSENWQQNSHSGNFVQFEGYSNFCLYSLNLPLANRGLLCDKLSYYGYDSGFRHKGIEGISDGGGYRLIFVRVKTEKLPTNDVAGFRQWLSQNPIEVSYMLSSNKDSTQVKQPIFFKDGHIQLSSGADNSLIPTLDYQAKTSNSYVMDLMKTNTKYTMKAKTASGTFTIDGTSYGAGTNGTFTTPSSITNKFLVMSNKTNEEVMIIEGDVTDKTIPYFKGIKSAFEDEDKIEVLSTGKNLFDGAFEKGAINVDGNLWDSPTAIRTVNYISVKPNASYYINLLNLEPFESLRVVYVHEYDENFKVLGETQVDNRNIYTSKSVTKFIKINTHNAHDLPVDSKMIVCENSTLDKQYEPHKSNNTKISLLSPLHSLPNGVRDELIIDRESNKVKIIQRVGKVMFDGSSDEVMWFNNGWANGDYVACYWDVSRMSHPNKKFGVTNMVCDKFPTVRSSIVVPGGIVTGEGIWGEDGSSVMYISLNKTKLTELSANGFRRWASQNPITVYYELKTPVVTEVDLEGFPYIYKDGHIFLNSKIVPTTKIIYSINQCQQISASNEDIIRHEKELTYLQKLISQYVQVDYESALLSLKV